MWPKLKKDAKHGRDLPGNTQPGVVQRNNLKHSIENVVKLRLYLTDWNGRDNDEGRLTAGLRATVLGFSASTHHET